MGDCLYRIEEWRNAPKDVAPFTVYMLSSNSGKGCAGFVGYFMNKKAARRCYSKKYNKNLES